MAAGVINYDNELNLGMIGMHGSVAANRAVDQADLVIALGARFSDRVALNPEKFARRAKIVQVDIDRSEINKNVIIEKCCVGDIRDFLTKIIPMVDDKKHLEWHERVIGWKSKERIVKSPECKLHPKEIMTVLSDMLED